MNQFNIFKRLWDWYQFHITSNILSYLYYTSQRYMEEERREFEEIERWELI